MSAEEEDFGIIVPMVVNIATCNLCKWEAEVGVPFFLGPQALEIMASYETLQHACTTHPDVFESITGKNPSAALAAYDQEIAQLGMIRIESD